MDSPVPKNVQERLSELLAQSRAEDLSEVKQRDPSGFTLSLAARFEYEVRQGGFAQLLYNMQGNWLAELEDMLIAASATVAQEYYVRAIQACLSNKPEYRRFLASNFTDANSVKDALHIVSIEYFAQKAPFAIEAAALLTSG